jgi:hypothetical protein
MPKVIFEDGTQRELRTIGDEAVRVLELRLPALSRKKRIPVAQTRSIPPKHVPVTLPYTPKWGRHHGKSRYSAPPRRTAKGRSASGELAARAVPCLASDFRGMDHGAEHILGAPRNSGGIQSHWPLSDLALWSAICASVIWSGRRLGQFAGSMRISACQPTEMSPYPFAPPVSLTHRGCGSQSARWSCSCWAGRSGTSYSPKPKNRRPVPRAWQARTGARSVRVRAAHVRQRLSSAVGRRRQSGVRSALPHRCFSLRARSGVGVGSGMIGVVRVRIR